jgi:hypothetical protein
LLQPERKHTRGVVAGGVQVGEVVLVVVAEGVDADDGGRHKRDLHEEVSQRRGGREEASPGRRR